MCYKTSEICIKSDNFVRTSCVAAFKFVLFEINGNASGMRSSGNVNCINEVNFELCQYASQLCYCIASLQPLLLESTFAMKLFEIFSALFFIGSAVGQDFLFSDEIQEQEKIVSRASVLRSQPRRISQLSNIRGQHPALNQSVKPIAIFSRMRGIQGTDGRSQHFWKLFSDR